jgi:hypothetical protein
MTKTATTSKTPLEKVAHQLARAATLMERALAEGDAEGAAL